MEYLTNEALFYGGVGVSLCSLVLGTAYFVFLCIRKIHLDLQLDEEYGKKNHVK